jgi:hypothetical protein
MKRTLWALAVLVAMGGFLSAVAPGQTQRGPATLDDLLAELRGLRADLSQSAAASMRMQSLVARLSLQEQRINTMGRQLSDVNNQLEAITRERAAQEDHFKRFESDVATGSIPQDMPREQAEAEIARQKRGLSEMRAREQQLRAQAANVAALYAEEQGRWTEFNGRLDDLERALPPAPGRR